VSNAFLKIYEMMVTYDIISDDVITLKSFHFCEAPGMFIIGLNHYLLTKTKIKKWEWHGNSLTQTAEQTALSDSHGLIRKNKDKWLTGPEDSGDIRSLTNIEFFKEKLESVDFITSDCGICVDTSNLNKYEELVAETDYAQFINMINLLKIGGSGIIKTFIPLELASNVCIIYIMTQIFEEVYLSKPITSRPQNSEVYLIGKKFLGIDNNLLNKLKQLLNKKINPVFNPHLCWIENIPQSFINQLEDYIIDITRQQISYLLNIFYFVDNSQLMDQITLLSKGRLKEKTNEYWCKKFKFEVNKFNKLI
jgi:23S rRNA U2552 (ribose-2'-O)-methylase RlmE/FtsJ